MTRAFDSHRREVFTGAAWAFIIKVVSAGIGFALSVLLARVLGPHDLGLYALAQSMVAVAATFSRLGYENALVKQISASLATNQRWRARAAYQFAMRHAFAASLILAAANYLAADWVAASVFGNPQLAPPLRASSFAILGLSLLTLQGNAFQGRKEIAMSSSLSSLMVPLFCLLMTLATYKFQTASLSSSIYSIACVLTAAIGMLRWHFETRADASDDRVRVPGERIFDGSRTAFFGISLLQMVMLWASTIILGMLGTEREVGVFNAANKTAMLTIFITVAMNAIAAPKFSELWSRQELGELRRLLLHLTIAMVLISLPVFAVFVLAPGRVMQLFGHGYEGGASCLRIISVGLFVNVCLGSMGHLLMMCGGEREMRAQLFIAGIINVGLALVLVPRFGASGAAIATGFTFAAQALLSAYYVKTRIFGAR